MLKTTWLKAGMTNIALLLAVILPLFLILSGLLARATGRDPEADVIGTTTVLFPGFLGPMLVGGLIYLALLFMTVARARGRERLLAVGLTPLLALGFVLFSAGHVLAISHFLAAFALAALVFGFLVRIPAADQRREGA